MEKFLKVVRKMAIMELKELIAHMGWLIGPTWYIDETKPSMRKVKGDERDRLNLKYNKLRGHWLAGVIGDCRVALLYHMPDDAMPVDVRESYKEKVECLNNDFRSAVENDSINRQLVEKAESLMKEVRGYLEAIRS